MDSTFQVNETKESKKYRIQAFVLSKEGSLILLSMLVAFLFRLFLIRYQYVINTDGVYYAVLGKKLIHGDFAGGLSGYWSPLYPFLVGISSLVFNDLEFAGRFVSVVAGTLLILPVYLLIRDIYGRRQATLGAILVIIFPALTNASTEVMTEATYTLFFTSGILIGWYALRDSKSRNFLFAGLLFGACYLLKPEAIAYLGLLLFLTFSTKLFYKHLPVKTVAFNALILLLGFLVLSLPYFLYLHYKTGRWTISQKTQINIAMVNDSKGLLSLTRDGQTTIMDQMHAGTYQAEIEQTVTSPSATSSSTSQISAPSSRLQTIQNLKGKLAYSLKMFKIECTQIIPQLFPYLFIFISLVGLFRKSWTKIRAGKEIYLFLFLISTMLGYAVTVVDTRYLIPVLPILLCWTSNGIIEFENWLIKSSARMGVFIQSRRLLFRSLIVAALILSLVPSIIYPMRVGKWDNLPYEQKQAGLWIKEHSGPSPLIMAIGPWPAFYAKGKHIYIPTENYPTIIGYARRKKVNYLVIGSRCMENLPCAKDTSLYFLLNEQNTPEDLRLVYKNDEMPDYKILIYEIKDRSEISASAF